MFFSLIAFNENYCFRCNRRLSRSGLYTITRPMGLTNSEFTGEYRETAEGVPKKSMSIPRADVVHFIVKALDDPRYENRSIGLAT